MRRELFLTTRQKTELRNVFANNMSKEKNLAKHNCLKTKSVRFRGIFLGKISGPMMKVAVPLTRNILAPLATMASAYASNGAIERKLRW